MSDAPVAYRACDELSDRFPFKIYAFQKAFTQPVHTHDYIQIWFVRRGGCTHWMNGRAYPLATGSIFVLPPDIPHYMECTDPETALVGMEFAPAFIQPDVEEGSFWSADVLEPFIVSLDQVRPRFPLEGAAAKTVETALDEILWEFQHQEPGYQLFIRANVLKVLAIISRQYGKKQDEARLQYLDRYRDSVTRAVTYLNENFQKKLYLEEVARVAMMSATSFSCVFKEVTGRTFTEQLNFLRVRKAKELLASGEVRSISAATRSVDLSRSAFYKYKDCIFDSENGREVVTVMATLRDETGALQSLLAGISAAGASIVTINQSTPENGAALVAVTIRTDTMQMTPEELTERLSRQRMVVGVHCGYNL